jgi:aerobic-type carbon monoxide dehydrogenase small subunit (CoxS/CutS family)
MPIHELRVNGRTHRVEAESEMPLLWVLRERLGLPGTKYGCGVGTCGACTVLHDGRPVHACQLSVREAASGAITTIEGLERTALHPVQEAWLAEDVAQCGYCQPAAILTAVALLDAHARPDDAQVDEAYAGFVCRCGSYARMRRAIHRAAGGDAR